MIYKTAFIDRNELIESMRKLYEALQADEAHEAEAQTVYEALAVVRQNTHDEILLMKEGAYYELGGK